MSSCVSPEKLRKETVYFNEGLDTAKLNMYQLVEPVIQKGDLLQISISSRSHQRISCSVRIIPVLQAEPEVLQ